MYEKQNGRTSENRSEFHSIKLPIKGKQNVAALNSDDQINKLHDKIQTEMKSI